jgi:hypothetical protein
MKKCLLIAALVTVTASAMAETIVKVSGSGDSEYCYAESSARSNAELEARGKAYEACDKQGGRLGDKLDKGSETVKACTGFEKGNFRIKVQDAQFACKLAKTADSSLIPYITTASGKTREEACKAAQSIDSSNAKEKPGECACEVRGHVHICRVQTLKAKPDTSLITKAKGALREKVQRDCQQDPECANQPDKSVGFGVRD